MIWNLLKPQPAVPAIAAADLAAKLAAGERLTVIDVREPNEYRQGHVPGCQLIPLGQLGARLAEIPQSGPVYVMCHSGGRSGQAARQLAAAGVEAVNVAGGMLSYPGPVER